MKQPVHFRLSQEAIALLQRLADTDGISRTAMLEISIREAARKRGIRADSGTQTQNQSGTAERD